VSIDGHTDRQGIWVGWRGSERLGADRLHHGCA
jgi:hypothetical protein